MKGFPLEGFFYFLLFESISMYLIFFDFSFNPDFQLFLPTAYIAENRNTHWYMLRKASEEVLRSIAIPLSEAQKEALKLVNHLQMPILIEKYIPKGNLIEDIYKNRDKKRYIQQQIEEKTAKLIEIIIENDFYLSLNYVNRQEILEKYHIKSTKKELVPFLEFEKGTNGIHYRLSLYDQGQPIIPSEHKIELLNNLRSWVVIDKNLMKLKDINVLHIKPFLDKTEVFIPEKLIPEYFNKFLKEVLKKAEISTIGFDMIQKSVIISSKIKFLHDVFINRYKIYIEFDYDGYIFYSNQSKKSYSSLEILPNEQIRIYNYKRNHLEELKKYHMLEEMGFINEGGNFSVEDTYPFATYFQLLLHKEELLSKGFIIESLEIGGKSIEMEPFELLFEETKMENDWFDINIWVQQGENRFHFSSLVKNIKESNPIYISSKGSIFIIPKEWFSKYEKIAKFGKIEGEKLRLPKNNYALLEDLPEVKPQHLSQKIDYSPSPNLKATLRPYQREGVKWLLEHYYNGMGACLADDMGLGKTLQTLALLVDIHDKLPEKNIEYPEDLFQIGQKQKEALKVLVILPSSLVFNWYDEAKRFAPQLKCTQYVGNDRKVKAKRLLNYDIVFTSYPIVIRDAKIFEKYEFRYIILDESQRIKNKDSQIFKVINSLQSSHRISLSGTPIENSLTDLWSQMQFINPNILGTFAQFNKYFKTEIEKKKNPVALAELKTIISPFLLRRTKEQVLDDLPEMEEQIAYCELSQAQRKWYESEKSKVRNQLLLTEENVQISTLNMLTKLRQLSNHPKLLDKESDIPSGKYEEVISYLELINNSSQKALIFSSFVSHLEIYQEWCQVHHMAYATLTGSVSLEQRKLQVEAFQNDPKVSFFFISLKAGEVGLNLTAASYVLLLDPWWNPFSERQAIARAHRLGQQHKVNVIRFVAKDTLEEKIIRLQENKKELSGNIIEEHILMDDVFNHLGEILE